MKFFSPRIKIPFYCVFFIGSLLYGQSVLQDDITWENVGPGGGGAMTQIAIDPQNENIVYVGTDLAGIFKSTDGGQSFVYKTIGLSNLVVQQIVIDRVSPNILYVGTEGGIYKSTDYGETWVLKRNGFPPISSGHLSAPVKGICIDPNDHNTIYAGIGEAHGNRYIYYSSGYQLGTIYKSTDQGENWFIVNTGANNIDTGAVTLEIGVCADSSNIIFATTTRGLYKSTDGGVNWFKKTSGIPHDDVRGLAVHPTNPDIIYITVITPGGVEPWQGGVYKSTDRGETWVAKNAGLKHRNDGPNWFTSNYPYVFVYKQNPDILYTGDWAYGPYGPQKSTDGGETWVGLIQAGYGNINLGHHGGVATSAMALSQINADVLYFGTSMNLYKTINGGEQWLTIYTNEVQPGVWQTTGIENTCLYCITIDPQDSNVVYMGYADISLMKSTDGGITYKKADQGLSYKDDITAITIDPVNPQIVYAADATSGSGGKCVVVKSTDGGNSWTVIGDSLNGLTNQGFIYSIVLDPTSSVNSRILYITKNGAGVYKTTDGGNTWFTVNNGLGTNLSARVLCLDPTNPLVLYLGLTAKGSNGVEDYGGIYKTIDGGNTWSKIDQNQIVNVWDIEVVPNDPDIIYVGACRHYDALNGISFPGGVYRSTDGGSNWVSVLARDKIATVAINPVETSIIYAGTIDMPYHDTLMSEGVFKSTDGGNTWQCMCGPGVKGNTTVWSITISPHNPRTIYLSTFGRGVFKGTDMGGTISEKNEFSFTAKSFVCRPTITKNIIYFSNLSYPGILFIYNATGRRVLKKELKSENADLLWNFRDENAMSPGVYFYKIIDGMKNTKIGKFVILR